MKEAEAPMPFFIAHSVDSPVHCFKQLLQSRGLFVPLQTWHRPPKLEASTCQRQSKYSLRNDLFQWNSNHSTNFCSLAGQVSLMVNQLLKKSLADTHTARQNSPPNATNCVPLMHYCTDVCLTSPEHLKPCSFARES